MDYDGTITDVDTFDVLVRECAGPRQWASLERCLSEGSRTLREVLGAQARYVRMTLDEADELLAARTHFDPAFASFAQRCAQEGVPLTIVSSGIGPLIERALARHGLAGIPVFANDVEPRKTGWRMRFRDASENGHDKAAAIRAAKESYDEVVFAGDGHSDFDAALAADVRFAKRGRALERFLQSKGVSYAPFDSFAQIERALFG